MKFHEGNEPLTDNTDQSISINWTTIQMTLNSENANGQRQ